ncbi:TPA: 50S ribosomal protein L21 [Candidatus Dependentiae bacterium]|nr:MAG: 50S ribosomal protein L21 [candidate division TM6 bacterium GW2011_GWF2_43_87]HBL98784.1 50S ribosomal protein L21 [Candidatus Dependentiae bacterium]
MKRASQENKELVFDKYAIFQTGGKQYQALEGKTVAIEKLDAKEGEEIVFKDVLLRRIDKKTVEVGTPFLSTPIKAVVIKHGKGPKLIAFMFKRRKKVRRKIGHRQPLTVVRVLSF